MKTKFTIGVFGIILDEQERVLLCHRRDYDLWNLPGGALKSGESPLEGVKREVKEETGLEVDVSKLLGVYTKPVNNDIVLAFICTVTGGEISLNDEADRVEYFEVDKIPLNTSSKHIERVKDAIENPKEVLFKVQTGKSSIQLIKEGKL
ncbi:MAG: NUDIX domain-containing protein [Patescibacteria group bacterium]